MRIKLIINTENMNYEGINKCLEQLTQLKDEQ